MKNYAVLEACDEIAWIFAAVAALAFIVCAFTGWAFMAIVSGCSACAALGAVVVRARFAS